jgi:hypothetical protein
MSTVRIQLRRGTAADWTSVNPTLAAGEAGYETDTHKIKIGTGSTAWNSLSYATVTPAELADAVANGIGSQLTLTRCKSGIRLYSSKCCRPYITRFTNSHRYNRRNLLRKAIQIQQ